MPYVNPQETFNPQSLIEFQEDDDDWNDHYLYDYAMEILFGVAVGDALGVPVEFQPRSALKANPVTDMREYGTYNQPKGTWSDDSAMTFCLAESLSKAYNLDDIAQTSLKWLSENYWTPHGEVFDIGIATRKALMNIHQGISPTESGGQTEMDNGNGALMRILPLVFELREMDFGMRYLTLIEVVGFTHNHIRNQIACTYYLEFALQLLEGRNKFIAYETLQFNIREFILQIDDDEEVKHFERLLEENIWDYDEDSIQSSGYVIHTLEAAIWCLMTTDNYRDAVLKAVNLGEDTDTTAAVTGGLAALLYGFDNIPTEWINQLARKEDILDLAKRFAKRYIDEED